MPNVKLLALGQGGNELTFAKWLDDLLNKASDSPPNPSICRDISQEAVLSLVYTSGTTGLPKAAIIKQKRIYLTSMGFAKQFNVGKKDRIYCTLPLYHSSGGTLGLGMMINCGATLVLRSKFSARNFFKDVHDSKATVTQYIGELCRYLLATPPSTLNQIYKLF